MQATSLPASLVGLDIFLAFVHKLFDHSFFMSGEVICQVVKSVRLLQYRAYKLKGLLVGMCSGRDLNG